MSFYNKNIYRKIMCAKIAIIGFICLLAFQGSTLSATAKLECYSFENETDIDSFGYTDWYQTSPGYRSSCSLKSGVIDQGKTSSIFKDVVGPANVSFYWRAEEFHNWAPSVKTDIGKFSFLVDGNEIHLDRNADGFGWNKKEIEVEDGKHVLEWRFLKRSIGRNIPESAGAGWIDNICIEKAILGPEEPEPEPEVTEPEPEVPEPEPEVPEPARDYYNKTTYVDKYSFNESLYIYKTIKEAIEHIEENGTVIINPGIYDENVKIEKPLTLIGSNELNSIIHTNGTAILIEADHVTINSVAINEASVGIRLINNKLNCIIFNNRISDCKKHGMVIEGVNAEVSNNYVNNSRENGIVLLNPVNCDVHRNELYGNIEHGLYILSGYNNFIDGNYIKESKAGIRMDDQCTSNIIGLNNIFESNFKCDIVCSSNYNCYTTSLPGVCELVEGDVLFNEICLRCDHGKLGDPI